MVEHHQLGNSDEDTTNDLHNMSDFSEDDGKVISDRSRQSSSRFSDNRPLISSANTSPGHNLLANVPMSPMILGMSPGLSPLPEGIGIPPNFSPSHRELRFNSLQKAHIPIAHTGFSTRTRLARHPRTRGTAEMGPDQNFHTLQNQQHLQNIQYQLNLQNQLHLQNLQNQQHQQNAQQHPSHESHSSSMIPEQLQQQVQIPDLRRMPVSVKSSEYIMAKIQNHMDQKINLNRQPSERKEREV